MELIHEGVLLYNGSERVPSAHCYVRIYIPESIAQRDCAEKSLGIIERPIIVLCQMGDNTKMSITNKMELASTIAWRDRIPSPERWNYQGPIVILHYPGKRVQPGCRPQRPTDESFDWVEMEVVERMDHIDPRYHHLNYARWLAKPHWSNIPREELERHLGQPFPPFALTLDEVKA